MKIHVVIPTIGRDSLEKTLSALAGQDWDGVHVIFDREKNVSKVRNRGMELAIADGADYVAFIDDDAIPRSNYIRELRRLLTKEKPAFIQGGIVGGIETSEQFMFVSANVILSKTCLLGLHGFDESYRGAGNEDLDLGWRAEASGYTIRYWPTVEVRHPTAPQHIHLAASDKKLAERFPDRWETLQSEGTSWQ